jgi:hypothetical protein
VDSLLQDGHGRDVVRVERAAVEHLGHDDAEREQIRRWPNRLAEELLGRHVRGRPQHHPVLGEPLLALRVRGLRDAEVEQLHEVRGGAHEEDVCGLDVAVDDARAVGGLEGGEDLRREVRDAPGLQRPALLDLGLERVPLEQLERDEERPPIVEPRVDDPDDVGVRDASDDVDLALETLLPARHVEHRSGDDLERDPAAGGAVVGLEHRAEAALTEQARDLVTPGDDAAERRRRRVGLGRRPGDHAFRLADGDSGTVVVRGEVRAATSPRPLTFGEGARRANRRWRSRAACSAG